MTIEAPTGAAATWDRGITRARMSPNHVQPGTRIADTGFRLSRASCIGLPSPNFFEGPILKKLRNHVHLERTSFYTGLTVAKMSHGLQLCCVAAFALILPQSLPYGPLLQCKNAKCTSDQEKPHGRQEENPKQ